MSASPRWCCTQGERPTRGGPPRGGRPGGVTSLDAARGACNSGPACLSHAQRGLFICCRRGSESLLPSLPPTLASPSSTASITNNSVEAAERRCAQTKPSGIPPFDRIVRFDQLSIPQTCPEFVSRPLQRLLFCFFGRPSRWERSEAERGSSSAEQGDNLDPTDLQRASWRWL